MELISLISKYEELRRNEPQIQVDDDKFTKLFYDNIQKYLLRMSSGHAIVLFTITRLVDVVGEKSLVLFDEPEVHLHPPCSLLFTNIKRLTRCTQWCSNNCNSFPSSTARGSKILHVESPTVKRSNKYYPSGY